MRSLLLTSLLIAVTGVPSLAAGSNDQGIIRTRGTITASCSVDDLSLTLQKDGSDKLIASGQLNVAQNGLTEWAIGKTVRQNDSGQTQFNSLLTVKNSGFGLDLTSGSNQTDKQTISNDFNGKADVNVTLTSPSGSFGAGVYQTQTTIQCITK